VHFSTNLWYDIGNDRCDGTAVWRSAGSPRLRFDRALWDEYVRELADCGSNAIVIDLGDAMIYDSHPEIAVGGAFTKDEMRAELDRLNALGFEVIPKLNFSATHDVWLGDYSRMLSTERYYEVCLDLIRETAELFDARLFHIGFDEETYEHQKDYDYITVRCGDLWWHDLKFMAKCVEECGARALVWSDYARTKPEEFVAKLPKTVVPVNWYYFGEFGDGVSDMARIRIQPFHVLEEHGFDQIPGGSVEYCRENIRLLAEYCKEHIAPERLLGFIQTTWASVEDKYKDKLLDGAITLGEAIAAFENR
jgi:hypothetical protein